MPNYEISGIKERTDYSFALKSLHEEIGVNLDDENRERKNKKINLKYNNEKGVLSFSIDAEINIFKLNLRLAEKGLELKVLEE